MNKKLTPQQLASKKQTEKRKGEPRFAMNMTIDEKSLLEKLASVYGSKKAAIFTGLHLLDRDSEK